MSHIFTVNTVWIIQYLVHAAASVAQSHAHATGDQKVAGLIPTRCGNIFCGD